TREGSISVSRAPRRKAARITAYFPSGTKWEIEVARNGKAAAPKTAAPRNGSTKVIAKFTPQGVEYVSARTGRRLTPPGKR
ncbi:MAG: hypothetical protein HAW59_05315, partial [Betaproteobacteria bacterium]|nr:hypothetical protein [Betaproteobacteria bacterium]